MSFTRQHVGDTACIDRQVRDFHVPMYRAPTICRAPVPDLTGDYQMQLYADAWGMSYRINPTLDAEIKKKNWNDMVATGSHIPDSYDLTSSQLR